MKQERKNKEYRDWYSAYSGVSDMVERMNWLYLEARSTFLDMRDLMAFLEKKVAENGKKTK